jgi:hypothetical protein
MEFVDTHKEFVDTHNNLREKIKQMGVQYFVEYFVECFGGLA